MEHTCIDCGDSCDCGEEAIDCLACSVCADGGFNEDDSSTWEDDSYDQLDEDLPADDDPL